MQEEAEAEEEDVAEAEAEEEGVLDDNVSQDYYFKVVLFMAGGEGRPIHDRGRLCGGGRGIGGPKR